MEASSAFFRGVLVLTIGAAAAQLVACEVGNRRGAQYAPQPAHVGPPPAVVEPKAESYRPASGRQVMSALLYLPGAVSRRLVQFEVVDGMAVMEGDILLGPLAALAFRYGMPWQPASNVKGAVTLSNRSHLWANGDIPYVIDGSAQSKADWIQWAIGQVNETSLNVRPRTAADSDYVVFRDSGSGCSSYLGRIGGAQEIEVGGCGKGSIIHEILHASGFYHEQSRGDRDEYVSIVWDEITPGYQSAFEKRDDRGQDIGPYDYGSIMHYGRLAFSRTGKPTIITKNANASIGQRDGMSPYDKAAVESLYGAGGGVGTPTTPTMPPTTPTTPPVASNGSFAGNYTSQRGNVSCSQNGGSVSCQYPGGAMFCAANGNQLDCGWSGGGQGRAVFQRQGSGVLAGTYGDMFSATSRGAWDLTPAQGSAPPPSTPPPSTPPPSGTGSTSLSGNYSSTRGPMACTDGGSTLACTFSESGAQGRLDCNEDASGLNLACTWVTFFPRPGTGRANFTRSSASSRDLKGTWGWLHASSGAGSWDAQGQ
jgi:hypothetical protein